MKHFLPLIPQNCLQPPTATKILWRQSLYLGWMLLRNTSVLVIIPPGKHMHTKTAPDKLKYTLLIQDLHELGEKSSLICTQERICWVKKHTSTWFAVTVKALCRISTPVESPISSASGFPWSHTPHTWHHPKFASLVQANWCLNLSCIFLSTNEFEWASLVAQQ